MSVSTHHFSDSERLSYVEYINKSLDSEEQQALPLPIDPLSPTELFEVVSEGVLLVKLINQHFPGTVNEKQIVTKKDKNTFEKNINNELAVQAAKDLGCSIVNIGADDLTSGRAHLILGLLWQVIKKSLLRQVNLASNPELERLRSGADQALETMAPDQVLLSWMNYHLKRAKIDRVVSNFASDIGDSVIYSELLRQIAPDVVSQEDLDAIKGEEDLVKRAEMLIELAKKVLGDSVSIFVRPTDIVEQNPRLNLAFVASLFNSHPALGPSEEELAKVESEFELLRKEKAMLESSVEKIKQEKDAIAEQLAAVQAELIQTQVQATEQKENLEKQLSESSQLAAEKEAQLQQEKSTTQELTQQTQQLSTQVSQLEAQYQTIVEEKGAEKQQAELVIQQKDSEIQKITTEKEESIAQVTKEKEEKAVEMTKEKEVMSSEFADEKKKLEALLEERDAQLKEARAEIAKLVEELNASKQEMIALKESSDIKIVQLKDTIQKLNDMLPERNVKEGFLTKQGGGNKSWQKRYFVMKNNFVCYYKDQKSLKHPAGVVDLNDCRVGRVDQTTFKKKFCFEIATPTRTYFVKGSSDEEVTDWIDAIEKAKARFKSDIEIRKTFLSPLTGPVTAEHLM